MRVQAFSRRIVRTLWACNEWARTALVESATAIEGNTMIRGDLSDRLIHLTRGETLADTLVKKVLRDTEAQQRFWSIVRSCKLIASTGNIVGGHKCVCFSEAPIAVLAQMLAPGDAQYAPLGVMVDKAWLFNQGGRPVIYQPRAEYDVLPDSHKYRHVNYDPINAAGPDDVTWEREWRVQCDSIPLDPAQVTLIVPFRSMVESYKQGHLQEQQDEAYALGDAAFQALQSPPWHFLVLEDLGLEIDFG
jgi:hypothetical protein